MMSRKGENIYIRKDGRWEGRYIKNRLPDGRYRYGYVYAKSYREAKEKLALKKSAVLRMPVSVKIMEPSGSKTTFGSIACSWLGSRLPKVKESTYIKYRNTVRAYLQPELGGLAWDEIRWETVELFSRKMLLAGGRAGNGLSAKTVSDILSIIRNIFRYASACGYPLPCDICSITVRQEAREPRILNKDEHARLCRFLYENVCDKNVGILIALFTGLRVGEICALKWEDISFEEQTIYVHQTMQRLQTGSGAEKKTAVLVSTPKSRCSIRRIPMPDSLAELLLQYRNGKKGFVLTGREDTYMEPRALQRHFKRVLQKAALDSINFHTLRHTFATRCVELDFDIKTLSEILGHASVNITMNRYVHPSMELKRESMQRLSKLLAVS